MDTQERAPSGSEEEAPDLEKEPRPGPVIFWRRILVATLVAGVAFLVLFVLRDVLYEIAYLGSIVFLPVGLWVGRRSRHPWADGAVYGLLSGLVACLVLLSIDFPLWWGGLVLALPQGIAGAWVGARLWPARSKRRRFSGSG
jgi:hypothetical protein